MNHRQELRSKTYVINQILYRFGFSFHVWCFSRQNADTPSLPISFLHIPGKTNSENIWDFSRVVLKLIPIQWSSARFCPGASGDKWVGSNQSRELDVPDRPSYLWSAPREQLSLGQTKTHSGHTPSSPAGNL